jgi:hypothetical protein
MGVGYDVNSRLLDRISRINFGQSEFVRPDEDIERIVGRLYSRISEPVMTEVAIGFDLEGLRAEDGSAVNRVVSAGDYDLFAGEQLVIVGRYRKPGDAKVTITGKVGHREQKMDFPAKLVEQSNDESYAFVEKLWAMRRIGEIIDELDLKGKNDELVKELVALSTKHGILTPYTSFLADENAKPGELASIDARARRADAAVDRLASRRAAPGSLSAPRNGCSRKRRERPCRPDSAAVVVCRQPTVPGGRIPMGAARRPAPAGPESRSATSKPTGKSRSRRCRSWATKPVQTRQAMGRSQCPGCRSAARSRQDQDRRSVLGRILPAGRREHTVRKRRFRAATSPAKNCSSGCGTKCT